MSFIVKHSSRFFACAAPILIILACWGPLKASSDIWAHAAVGRWIVQHQTIPHSALFLWSYHGAWTAHSWLSELGTYEIMRLGGDLGGPVLLVTLSTLAILGAFGIALWPLVKDSKLPTLAAIVFIAALMAASPRFEPRPELFTTLFTPLLCAAVLSAPIKPTKVEVLKMAWIPLLFVLWTNVHGAVLFGIVCLWVVIACDWFQTRRLSYLSAIGLVSVVALLVNPEGVGLLGVFKPLTNQSFAYIEEWRPFWISPSVPFLIPISEALLLISSLTSWHLAGRKRLAELGLILLSTLAFLSARRNMDLMALICLLIFCRNYADAGKSSYVSKLRDLAWFTRLETKLLVACAALFSMFLVLGCNRLINSPFVATTLKHVPAEQADLIANSCPVGTRILNFYDSAAFLEWKLGERRPLFIDGMNAYPNSVYDDWVQVWNATPRGLVLFEQLHIGCVAGEPIITGQPLPGLYSYLVKDKSWKLIYTGSDGPVFIKTVNKLASKANGQATYLTANAAI